MSSPSSTGPQDPATLVTRLLAAAGDGGLPFASFEATMKLVQDRVPPLAEVSFASYAGDVTYSRELRSGLDEALARDWVRFSAGRLAVTALGLAALGERDATPRPGEREAFRSLAA